LFNKKYNLKEKRTEKIAKATGLEKEEIEKSTD
jgi:hypothetical protein